MTTKVLILPGIGDAGPDHWQTLWEKSNGNFQKVQQNDWDHPVCGDWVNALEKSVEASGPNVILVAHSLACLLVAHWTANTHSEIRGAFLAAPPDPLGPNFPKEATGFMPVPLRRFSFPSIVVASTNDDFGRVEFAKQLSSSWGSQFVNIGAAGHINSSSCLGHWREGFSIFQTLLA